jgi:predicted lipoprotein with Yx(FWY)xxD motif
MVVMHWRRSRLIPGLLGVSVLLAVLVALGVAPALAKGHLAAPAAALAKTAPAHILVTSSGRTVYVFAADKRDTSTCYGTCAKFWPPVVVPKGTTPPAKLAGAPGTFGIITRSGGKRQLTYDGAPLYTFAGDKKAGDMKGQGLIASGGYWWIVATGGI